MSSISHSKGAQKSGSRIKKKLTLKRPLKKAYLDVGSSEPQSLVASEKMYRDLVEMAHEGITMVDMEDNLTFVNRQFAKGLGYKVHELIGKSLSFISTKATVVKMKKEMSKRRRGKKSRYEVTLIHRDGTHKFFWLSASPMFGPSREFLGSMGVYADVTEKKIMEIKLEKKVKQIDTLYRVYGHARMAKPLTSVLKGVGQSIVQAFSFPEYVQSKLTFDGKTYSHPKKLKRFFQKIDVPLIISGIKRGSLQVGYSRKVSEMPQLNFCKEEQELIMTVANILTRHMYARDVFGQHREIVRKSFTAIVIVSGKKISYANPRFYRMFKCKKNQVIGSNIIKFFPHCSPYDNVDGKVVECKGRRMTGGDFELATFIRRIDHHGKPSLLIRVNDISALKKAQRKLSSFNLDLRKTIDEKTLHLKQANKRLQSLNQIKDEFIAITSHELRSPLTSIRGYLSFLVEDDSISQISEPYREYLIRAYSTTDSLNYLINNILDVSRLDMGRFELQKQDTDIIKLTSNILDSLSFQFNERRLQFEFINETGKEQVILSVDSIRLSQVLRNILDNSIKFTKRGKKVKVTVTKDSQQICVAVADQGVGIPKAKIDQVFDKFMQVKNTHTKYKGGVGLGLFIAKRIVELHGGEICAIKNNDGGTTISIYLPLKSKA